MTQAEAHRYRLNSALWRRLGLLAADWAIAAASMVAAMLLRFEGDIHDPYRTALPALAIAIGCYRVLGSVLLRTHRWSFRFSSLADAARIVMSTALGTVLFVATLYLLRASGPPRSVIVLEFLLTTLAIGAMRFSPRLAGMYASEWARSRDDDSLRTVIVGAGAAGEMLLRDLGRSTGHAFNVVGFVDDDPNKWNSFVGGKAVLGPIGDLPDLARRHRLDQVLIAIPLLQGRRVRELLSVCSDLKLRFKILPVSYVYLNERASAQMMKDLQPADLLHRDLVRMKKDESLERIAERSVLVTGAAGSIGSEVCRQLLANGVSRLLMCDVDENGLYLLSRRLEKQYPDCAITVAVANVRDRSRVDALFREHRPQDVIHAAAHKHVPLMEAAPGEAVKNNIVGTRIVAELSHVHRAERFVLISTDKAVRPTSVMGASKRVAEKIVRHYARRSSTRFCAVRFGNVLGSAGSVVPIFREQIEAGGPVSVTHPDVRRYFMTISEAVALVLQSGYGDFSELCVLDMGEQIKIVDLARHMITMSGLVPDVDVPIVYSGLRPGEKLYEELMTEEEVQTHRVSQKIFAAQSPPPPGDLFERIDEMAAAADAEEGERVVELLRALVPHYTTPVHAPTPERERDGDHAKADER